MKTIKNLFFIIIIFSVSVNYSQWQPDVRLTNDPAHSFTGETRCIAAKGDSVHIVWQEHRDGDAEIYYKHSTNRGNSWSPDQRLSPTPGFSGAPCMAVYQSFVHVAWEDQRTNPTEIYYRRSTDNGNTWETETRLTNNPFNSYYPAVSVSGPLVYVMWEDDRDGNYEIYFKRSTNSGLNWSSDTRLTNNSAASNHVSVSSSGLNIHCTWQDSRDGGTEIYYKRSTDAGITWGIDNRLSIDPAASTSPSIAATGQNINVFWSDQRDANSEIYYKHSTNGGNNWGSETRITNAPNNSIYPSAFALSNFIAVTWSDMRSGFYEIYYKASIDGGLNWNTDLQLTPSNNTGSSVQASIDISDSAAHVVWYDNRDGNNEIYYKRYLFLGPVGITNINNHIPEKFSLSQNYPNPFNPNTRINFSISQKSKVIIKVYSSPGMQVCELVNEKMEAGDYSVDFNGSNLSSGVYFYSLVSGNFKETKKMLLVK